MLGAGDYGGVGLETELMPIGRISRIAMIAITAKIAIIWKRKIHHRFDGRTGAGQIKNRSVTSFGQQHKATAACGKKSLLS
jgi:hypothetical protein